MPRVLRAAGARAATIEKVRHLGRGGSMLMEDLLAFGPGAGPATLAFADRMMTETRMDALIDFFASMITHEVISECAALDRADTLVIGAEHDRLTPLAHSLKIAECVPSGRLEIVPGSGHMAMLERPGVVSAHLTELVTRVRTSLAAD
jgi:pimeloyl-ACP methyl ester carboxylesterase